MWMLTNELHHTEKMNELGIDLEMHKLPENPHISNSHSVSLLEADMRAAAALSSIFCIKFCAPAKQHWPIFYQCRGDV